MLKQLSNSKLGEMVFIALGVLLSACAPAASAGALYADPCHPPTIEGNAYRQAPQAILGLYYQTAFSPQPNIAYEENFTNQRFDAIKLLATQTERWSDFIDIPLESKFIRITITYLSPELVQTIILNHYLFRRIDKFINGGFDAEILSKMEDIAGRNEHLFFITLTASEYKQDIFNSDPLIIQLPLESLVLTNSANIQVIPQHDNHNLEDRIDLTFAPSHGYFSYPMAVTVNENCEFLLDKTNDSHIVLSIPYIEINGTRPQTRPWVFDYVPLLHITPDPNPGENRLQVERTPEHFRPQDKLPSAINPVDAEYWETLARFIWYEITLDP